MTYNSIAKEKEIIMNYEGEKAYKMSSEMELYTAVVTSAMGDSFYESRDGRVERISELIRKVSPEFVAKLAIYAREQMNLRSIPLFLIVELAKIHNGDHLVRKTMDRVVLRADEIMETLACYQWRNGEGKGMKKLNKLSRQIQEGLKNAFNRFDEYQFAKYNRDNLEVKLKDALFIVHPKAKSPEQQDIFNRIVSGELKVPYTWETELSALGQQTFESEEEKTKAKRECWKKLLQSGKLGYMALLRNLRNIIEVGMDMNMLKIVHDRISSRDEVIKSRQLPFRFYAAYRELINIQRPEVQYILEALEKAAEHSAENVCGFNEDTPVFIACDVSGSMQFPVSPKSSVMNYDIGILLGSILKSKCKSVVTGIFGDTWLPAVGGPKCGVLENTINMHKNANKVGFSTNGHLAIDWLLKENIKVDKLMFFTDMQMWNSRRDGGSLEKAWKAYKILNPDAKLYLFDLRGYGQMPVKQTTDDVFLIAGWSEKVFEILDAIEGGESALEHIQQIEL